MTKVPWTQVKYSRNQINKAANRLCSHAEDYDTEKTDLCIVNNWRMSHAYPLSVIKNKLRRITDDNTLVVSRLKRMESILAKIKRFSGMSLYNMQDLAGCRVIVPTITEVYAVAEKFESSRVRHELCKTNDYIAEPKKDGYRSLHKIYAYQSDNIKSCYNKMKIEVQYRTKLQHAWATAVETMSIYTNNNLKAGIGSEADKRFFVLVSSLFAKEEGCSLVPYTCQDVSKLIEEIGDINAENHVIERLQAMAKTIRSTERILKNRAYYLMSLDTGKECLNVRGYKASEIQEAAKDYENLEKNKNLDTVLVTAETFQNLRLAYPNYFFDVSDFIDKVKAYLK